MAFTPHILNDMLDVHRLRYRPSSLFDQHFGLGVLNDDLFHPDILALPHHSGYYRPWRHMAPLHSGASHVNTTDGFKVNLDVQQFKPDEVSVKIADNHVVVEGNHEERQDEHGYVTRQLKRRYLIPDDVDPDTITSKLSIDGVLTIEGPKKALPAPDKQRVLSITLTNAPAITHTKSQGNTKPASEEKIDQ